MTDKKLSSIKDNTNESIESENGIFTCEVCQSRFTSNAIFLRHRSLHKDKHQKHYAKLEIAFSGTNSNKGKYQCSKCDKSFPTKRYLAAHNVKHIPHVVPKERFYCPHCKKLFYYQKSLSLHIYTCKRRRG